MSSLTSLAQGEFSRTLAWALVHFLWQGAALAIIGAVAMRSLAASAPVRYLVGTATMAAMLVAPVVTFLVITPPTAVVSRTPPALDLSIPPVPSGVGDIAGFAEVAATQGPGSALSFLLAIWVCGVVLFSVRLLGGWVVTRRLAARAVRPVTPDVQRLARGVSDRLGMRRLVRIVESSAVSVPVLIGWLKPVVLLPAAALAGLAPAQLEALLAHELAHIRRHDYLVNLLQSAVETLLFYHPAVWWISARVRAEREHCCDDLAVAVCDRLVYVSALTDLAAMTAPPRLALAATDGSLLRRVRRLLEGRDDARPASGWIAAFAVTLLAAGVAVSGIAPADIDERHIAGVSEILGAEHLASVERAPVATTSSRVPATAPTPVEIAGVVETPAAASANNFDVSGNPQPAPEDRRTPAGQSREDIARQREEREEAVRRDLEELRRVLSTRAPADDQRRQFQELTESQVEALQRLKLAELAASQGRISFQDLEQHLRAQGALQLTLRQAEDLVRQQRDIAAGVQQTGRQQAGAARDDQLKQLTSDKDELRQGVAKLEQQLADVVRQLQSSDRDTARRAQEVASTVRDQMVKEKIDYSKSAMTAGPEASKRIEDLITSDLEGLRERVAATAETTRAAEQLTGLNRAAQAAAEAVRRMNTLTAERTRIAETASAERRARLIEQSFVVTNPGEIIRLGDVLDIQIQGETDLPRAYEVAGDAKITLPLLGAIQAAGRTARDVLGDITTLLKERRLGATQQVTVVLRRPAPSAER